MCAVSFKSNYFPYKAYVYIYIYIVHTYKYNIQDVKANTFIE